MEKIKKFIVVWKTIYGNYYFDQEAIRVLNKMERWIPGKVSGEFVKVQYRQLINFL